MTIKHLINILLNTDLRILVGVIFIFIMWFVGIYGLVYMINYVLDKINVEKR